MSTSEAVTRSELAAYLILGEQRITNASQNHHRDQDRYNHSIRHGGEGEERDDSN